MTKDFEIIGEITGIEEIEDCPITELDETNRFAICIQRSDGYDTDPLKVYPVLDDSDAEQDGMIRIIDESGEDYLHAARRFILVTLSSADSRTLLQTMGIRVTTSH